MDFDRLARPADQPEALAHLAYGEGLDSDVHRRQQVIEKGFGHDALQRGDVPYTLKIV